MWATPRSTIGRRRGARAAAATLAADQAALPRFEPVDRFDPAPVDPGQDLDQAHDQAHDEALDRAHDQALDLGAGLRPIVGTEADGPPWATEPALDEAAAPTGGGGPRTVARLLSFTPHPPKQDRLCVDTAALLRPLMRAGIIDSWAVDHTYPVHRAWRLIPSRLARAGQLPLHGFVEPDGGITLCEMDDPFGETPLSMLDWILDWTSAGRLASHWWTTAVYVTTTTGLPATGTLRT
ncbi:hypothetical protein QEZ54_13995 [Catellatospora sp. KI3]|uniref:hypothetical protein n=1 Tax=Catellatospora sp. KI3 TaxID=3041620 RepID=UPI002482B87D|nr:hypothetical protein [Catellatospora sp. KI3]MDI1462082.1 hypothetical protein [Catellatospora sp. KI3]